MFLLDSEHISRRVVRCLTATPTSFHELLDVFRAMRGRGEHAAPLCCVVKPEKDAMPRERGLRTTLSARASRRHDAVTEVPRRFIRGSGHACLTLPDSEDPPVHRPRGASRSIVTSRYYRADSSEAVDTRVWLYPIVRIRRCIGHAAQVIQS